MHLMRVLVVGLLAVLFNFQPADVTHGQQFSTPVYRSSSPTVIDGSYHSQTIRRSNPVGNHSTKRRTYSAIPWYQSLVQNRFHDFGVVATASKQEHIFEFNNTTGCELLLTHIRTSCGCTKPSILTSQIQPGEKGQIKAVFDTRSFHGTKGATITVSVRKMDHVIQNGELQFAVKGKIRRDVVCTPGEVKFQDVMPAKNLTRKVRVSYAGNPTWKIVDAKCSSPGISVSVKELHRDVKKRRIDYELEVTLDPVQPAGIINEYVTIETNDARTNGMPIHITGRVKPVLEAAPILLGTLDQGKMITKKWIVRGTAPFRVEQVETNNPAIEFAECEGEKLMHILTYTLDTSQVGEIDEEISILTTNSGQNSTKVKFYAQIIPSTNLADQP